MAGHKIRWIRLQMKCKEKGVLAFASNNCALMQVQLGKSAQLNSSVGDNDMYLLVPTLENS